MSLWFWGLDLYDFYMYHDGLKFLCLTLISALNHFIFVENFTNGDGEMDVMADHIFDVGTPNNTTTRSS